MPGSTRKKLLNATLDALLNSIPIPTAVKLPAAFVSEVAKRFQDLPDDGKDCLSEATEDSLRNGLRQIDFAVRHAAEVAAAGYRIEEKLDLVAEAIRLLQRPESGVTQSCPEIGDASKSVFISHSSVDKPFVEKLYRRLDEEGLQPWLDKYDLYSGDLQKQIRPAVESRNVFVIVLSAESVNSDWVEAELDWARQCEKEKGIDKLCPVALDDSWCAKMDDVLWRQLKRMLVLDFSSWKTKAFETPFGQLVRGIEANY